MTESFEEADFGIVREISQEVMSEVARIIVGMGDTLQMLLIGLLTNGHVLLEGVPGLAKTVAAKTFAEALGISFNRIQFTPDLLPSDCTGSMVFDQSKGDFVIRKGPLFGNIILADEINRTAPKTQAALLEAMGEKQVTIEGKTYVLDKPFMVVATQNPIEQEGTYPLPEAQLDRFLFKLWLDYPPEEDEVEIMARQLSGIKPIIDGVTNAEEIVELQRLTDTVFVNNTLLEYIRDIVFKTRNDPQISVGCGPRASLSLMKASKARAAILGRDYITPDDVKVLCVPIMNHRIVLKAEAELEGLSSTAVINRILSEVPVPM
ncbi:MAG: AAA family ATPase [Promethearchaeota archaeon]